MGESVEPLKQPFEEKISAVVTGYYGFKDGHAEAKVSKGPFSLGAIRLDVEDIVKLKKFIDNALKFNELSEEERKRIGVQ